MNSIDTLNASLREKVGTNSAKKVRIANKIPAIVYGDGKQKRCFSYIDDCLSCLIPMLDQKNLNKQVINIGPDEEFVTVNKVVEICSNITGSNLEAVYKEDRPREVKHCLLYTSDAADD